jgi:hypothetical protein
VAVARASGPADADDGSVSTKISEILSVLLHGVEREAPPLLGEDLIR